MDKVETQQATQQGMGDVWRMIAQQSLQSALLLGVVGVGIKALMALAEPTHKKSDAPAVRAQQPIDVEFEAADEGESEVDEDRTDEPSRFVTKTDLEETFANLDAERKARQARFDALFDREAFEARSLLGVTFYDGADEIRRALRDKLADSAIHPDHGGDGAEAARLIAAKNLLISRLRARANE